MPREYRHIQKYEKEILELKKQGMTLKEIGKRYGFTYTQDITLLLVTTLISESSQPV